LKTQKNKIKFEAKKKVKNFQFFSKIFLKYKNKKTLLKKYEQ